MRRGVLLLTLPFLLVACGGSKEDAVGAADAAGINARLARAQLVVTANGLAIHGADGLNELRFGAPRAPVDAAAEKALKQMGEAESNADCGAGPMKFTAIGPLQLAYQGGKFIGWYLGEGMKSRVVTSDGVAAGTALARLKAERPVRVITYSSLEGEFEYQTGDAGTITGFFKGQQDSGTIEAFQAGMNCLFR